MGQTLRLNPVVRLLCCLLIFVGLFYRSAEGQAVAKASSAEGTIDQVLLVPFEPSWSFVLVETGLGEIQRFPAQFVSGYRYETETEMRDAYLAGARIPLTNLRKGTFHFSFFVFGDKGEFAATPISEWSHQMLVESTVDEKRLRERVSEVKRQVDVERLELSALEDKLRVLRDKASVVSGIDDIVDLNMELTRLKGTAQDSAVEQARLRTLISAGRQEGIDGDIDTRRQQLLELLTETAQATAMADRLSAHRREAARTNLQKKLALVKEMKSVDADVLAKTALELRARRRQLEATRNVQPTEAPTDF